MQKQANLLEQSNGKNPGENFESPTNIFATAYDPAAIQSERATREANGTTSAADSLPTIALFDGDLGIEISEAAPRACTVKYGDGGYWNSIGGDCATASARPSKNGALGQDLPPVEAGPAPNPVYLPRNRFEPGSSAYWRRELESAAQPEQRVRAAAHVGDGTASMNIDTDESVNVKIDIQPVDPNTDDGRSYVTIYAYDEVEKKYYVAFRGIYDEKTDTVSPQVDKNGYEVPYTTAEFEEKYKDKYPLLTKKDMEERQAKKRAK